MKNILVAIALLIQAAASVASDYDDEVLFEVLKSANLRAAPDLSSDVLELVPGGQVVAVLVSESPQKDWYRVISPRVHDRIGFIHGSLLAPYGFSYSLEETENEFHKIKRFLPTAGRYFASASPSRIYSKEGKYLVQLPRVEDTKGSANITVSFRQSAFPYYTIRYATGGPNCCYYYRFLSKDPFLTHSFDVDHRMKDEGSWTLSSEGDWLAEVYDRNYRYWSVSDEWFFYGAISPEPTVILQLIDGQPQVAADYMRTAPLSSSALQERVADLMILSDELPEGDIDRAMYLLTSELIDLIYNGNAESAFALLAVVWTDDFMLDYVDMVDREWFTQKLIEQVQLSPFYQPWMLQGIEANKGVGTDA
jgi:hypothetical protein